MAPVPTIAGEALSAAEIEVDDGAEVPEEVEVSSAGVAVCVGSVPVEIVGPNTGVGVVVVSSIPNVAASGVVVVAAGEGVGEEVIDAAPPKALVTLLGAEPGVRGGRVVS